MGSVAFKKRSYRSSACWEVTQCERTGFLAMQGRLQGREGTGLKEGWKAVFFLSLATTCPFPLSTHTLFPLRQLISYPSKIQLNFKCFLYYVLCKSKLQRNWTAVKGFLPIRFVQWMPFSDCRFLCLCDFSHFSTASKLPLSCSQQSNTRVLHLILIASL